MKNVIAIFSLFITLPFLMSGKKITVLNPKVKVEAAKLDKIFGEVEPSDNIIKIEDEVDGKKIVCYAISSSNGSGGRSIDCLQIQK